MITGEKKLLGEESHLQSNTEKSMQVRFGVFKTTLFVSNATLIQAQMPASFFTQVWAGHHQSLQPKDQEQFSLPRHPGCLCGCSQELGGEADRLTSPSALGEDYAAGKSPLHHLCFCFVPLTPPEAGLVGDPACSGDKSGSEVRRVLATWALDLRPEVDAKQG